jgi:hypothetical protein
MDIFAVVVALVVWGLTGSLGLLAIGCLAEGMLRLAGRQLAKRLALPAWRADESYIGQLRRWKADRNRLPDDLDVDTRARRVIR